ncbi:MAG: hypothetical protein A3F12_01275 [Gammaproteobacteria bacterium RIFCSPHIGHO2_12_FULL_38_14]|nr:MAG: hypothetical protein A3F12_01275 [Gammaproteobacteria bacterium RIFCSPHIGHO2_12_FULL_38_14]
MRRSNPEEHHSKDKTEKKFGFSADTKEESLTIDSTLSRMDQDSPKYLLLKDISVSIKNDPVIQSKPAAEQDKLINNLFIFIKASLDELPIAYIERKQKEYDLDKQKFLSSQISKYFQKQEIKSSNDYITKVRPVIATQIEASEHKALYHCLGRIAEKELPSHMKDQWEALSRNERKEILSDPKNIENFAYNNINEYFKDQQNSLINSYIKKCATSVIDETIAESKEFHVLEPYLNDINKENELINTLMKNSAISNPETFLKMKDIYKNPQAFKNVVEHMLELTLVRYLKENKNDLLRNLNRSLQNQMPEMAKKAREMVEEAKKTPTDQDNNAPKEKDHHPTHRMRR